MKEDLNYHVKLVYKKLDGKRRISEFDQATPAACIRILEFVDYKNWELVFMTVSDNTQKTRLQGAKPILTFYEADQAVLFANLEPLTTIYKQILEDFILSHEVAE